MALRFCNFEPGKILLPLLFDRIRMSPAKLNLRAAPHGTQRSAFGYERSER